MSTATTGARVRVQEEPSKGGYRLFYTVKDPASQTTSERTFVYNVSNSSKEKQGIIDAHLIKNVLTRLLKEKVSTALWKKKPNEIKRELVQFINRISRSSKREHHKKQFGFGGGEIEEEEEEEREGADGGGVVGGGGGGNDPPLPRKSMFAAEKESANTKAFLAPSFSGKTTLMADELNKLTATELSEYDKIVLFTESTSSAPLKTLSKEVQDKMLVFDRFVPQFVLILKKINNVTKNRFRFLLLLDDCLNLKQGVLVKLILTLRNANISTVICIQYSKLLSRSQRQSIHDYYIMNLKVEDLEYLMSGFLAAHFREFFVKEGLRSEEEVKKMNYQKLAELGRERLKDRILHFNQREDRIEVHTRQK